MRSEVADTRRAGAIGSGDLLRGGYGLELLRPLDRFQVVLGIEKAGLLTHIGVVEHYEGMPPCCWAYWSSITCSRAPSPPPKRFQKVSVCGSSGAPTSPAATGEPLQAERALAAAPSPAVAKAP